VRTDTDRLGDVLGWVASKHFPEAAEIHQMWARWIENGAFDGNPSSPTDLARYLTDANKERLTGWEFVEEALRRHVRIFLRSSDKGKIVVTMDHVQAAADAGARVLTTLLREANGVSGTAEWNGWKKTDLDAAEWMQWYVFEVAKEAVGERDWVRALNSTEKIVAFEKERRRILDKVKQVPRR
jgi:hypothetical protein